MAEVEFKLRQWTSTFQLRDWLSGRQFFFQSGIVDAFRMIQAHYIPCALSIQFSRSVVSNSLQPHGLQHARLPCPSPTPRAYSNSCPSSQWCHPTISSSVSPPALNLSQHQGLFQGVSSSHQVAKVLEFQLQYQSFQWIFRTDFL